MADNAGFTKFVARNRIGQAKGGRPYQPFTKSKVKGGGTKSHVGPVASTAARKPGDLPPVKQDQVRAELQKDRSMNRRKKRWKGDDMRPRDPKGVPRVGGGHGPERRAY